MLSLLRQSYQPVVPKALEDLSSCLFTEETSAPVSPEIAKIVPNIVRTPVLVGRKGESRSFSPLQIGVVFSGGPAPGGHNVVAGLFDGLKQLCRESRLFGFLGGPGGVIAGKKQELTANAIAPYRNQGGFDLLGTGRTKIETPQQFEACHKLGLDALIIIGGDDSNTSAALLANAGPTPVIGIPKTIDGDLQNQHVAISFGFDTAAKIYSEMIGNIARDAASARKYTHFIKLMGRSASHIAIECALATHPNLTLIVEEKESFEAITAKIADMVCQRSEASKDYGVILIPEGLADIIAPSAELDAHGNAVVSSVETELLLIEAVQKELALRKFSGKFQPIRHFLGYEGRCGLPTNFDANYGYALGMTAALLAAHRCTGVMAFISELDKPPALWGFGGAPLAPLMTMEKRKGVMKPVIGKAFVNLNGKPYQAFRKEAAQWMLADDYRYPGPIQFFGDPCLTDAPPRVLKQ